MGAFLELLIQNGLFAFVAWLVLSLGILGVGGGLVWLIPQGIKVWGGATPQSIKRVRKALWRITFLVVMGLGLLLIVGLGITTALGVNFDLMLNERRAGMKSEDWLVLVFPLLKILGLLGGALVLVRILRLSLSRLGSLLGQSGWASEDDSVRLRQLIDRLGPILSAALLLGTLVLVGWVLDLSPQGMLLLWTLAYVGVAAYFIPFATGVVHLGIDVLMRISQGVETPRSPLFYIARFTHLTNLTKRVSDYAITVGVATLVVHLITPITWAAQAGKVALEIIAIFYLSRVLVDVCNLFLEEFVLPSKAELSRAELQQRQTLLPVATGLVRYAIYFTAVVMSLSAVGFDPTPLIAGAGVVGLAVGLGAQTLVGDFVAGFFILFENVFLVGDYVVIDDVEGVVEEIGIRMTRIRDEAGVLHLIPNGEVRKVSSHSKGYVNVVIDLPLPYGEDVHRVIEALDTKMTEVRGNQEAIVGMTEFSLQDMQESVMLLRTVTMVKPGKSNDMSSVIRMELCDALTSAGIEAPFVRRALVKPLLPQRNLPTPQQHSPQSDHHTDIQNIKAYNFYLGLDTNGNGRIERADIQALGQRLLVHSGAEQKGEISAELSRRLDTYWAGITALVDRDTDGLISKEEFLRMYAALARDLKGPVAKSVECLSDALFLVSDQNGTGGISQLEFVAFGRAFGLTEAVAVAGFNLIHSGRKRVISHGEWHKFIVDIFVSHKLTDASSVVFGPGSRDND